MNYGRVTRTTMWTGYRNLVGLIAVSVLISLSLIPLAATVIVESSIALLGGLWATCLLLGVAAIAALDFVTVVADRGVPIAVRPSIAAALRNPKAGLGVGAITFAVVIMALVLIAATPESLRAVATGVAGFLLFAWYLVGAFASPELGTGQALLPALVSGAIRIGRAPGAVAWFLVPLVPVHATRGRHRRHAPPVSTRGAGVASCPGCRCGWRVI